MAHRGEERALSKLNYAVILLGAMIAPISVSFSICYRPFRVPEVTSRQLKGHDQLASRY